MVDQGGPEGDLAEPTDFRDPRRSTQYACAGKSRAPLSVSPARSLSTKVWWMRIVPALIPSSTADPGLGMGTLTAVRNKVAHPARACASWAAWRGCCLSFFLPAVENLETTGRTDGRKAHLAPHSGQPLAKIASWY
ncbi:hypothetical protein ANO11243_008650 [Dothideomycetidae sp. 11243]|nr:hypothetical protein ANO11243_008650 [fungal sp. No.11243]